MSRIDEIRERCETATAGPWAWESTAEKSNEFVVGIAIDKNDNPICGEILKGFDEDNDCFMDEEIIRKSEIGNNESGSANFADADFIAHAREDIPYLLQLLDRAKEIITDSSIQCCCMDKQEFNKCQHWLSDYRGE